MLMIRKINSGGFALPSILIASVVMLMVLVTAITAVVATRTALDDQYYRQLARNAAESGIAKATACIRQNSYLMTWSGAGGTLTPQTACSGVVQAGLPLYVSETPSERTTFTLTESAINGAYYTIESTGTVELLRSSNGDVWKRYTSSVRTTINYVAAYASKSASGYAQTCGIINAEAWCWGSNNTTGKLGNGTTDDALVPTRVLRETGLLSGKTDTDIAVGNYFACVVADSKVYCWGSNQYGQLARGTTNTTANPVPARVTEQSGILLGKTVTQVVAGGRHACALTTEGRVYCWGRNDFGQLGNNSIVDSSIPVAVSTAGVLSGKIVTKLAAVPDTNTTCAIADSIAYCWGGNASGELGIGSAASYSAIPRQITGLLAGRTVTDIALSSQGTVTNLGINAHACAVADGEAYCWGSNLLGMLGDNTTTNSTSPVKVQKLAGGLAGKTVSRIVTGHPHTCALTTDNLVFCWGGNANGQLGNNASSTPNSLIPIPVYTGIDDGYGLGSRTITDITGGGNRACVIASGTNFCWGLNSQYQIGDGTTISRFRPTVASYLELRKLPVVY